MDAKCHANAAGRSLVFETVPTLVDPVDARDGGILFAGIVVQALDFINDVLMHDTLSVNPDKAFPLGQILFAFDLKLVGAVRRVLVGRGGIGEPPEIRAETG